MLGLTLPSGCVFVVTSSQEEGCGCCPGGVTSYGVYSSAVLARGAARRVLFELYPKHVTDLAFGFETYQDSGSFDKLGRVALLAECARSGVECGGGPEGSYLSARDLRGRLMGNEYEERMVSTRASLLAEGKNPDDAEDELNEVMNEEEGARMESAIEYYKSGALDALKFFSGRDDIYEEHWDGEDLGGRIFAPCGGSSCSGEISATIQVTCSVVQTRLPAAGVLKE